MSLLGTQGLTLPPMEHDGRPVVVISPFTEGLYMFTSCRGDQLIDGTVSRGTGDKMMISFSGVQGEDSYKEAILTFYEFVEIHDGHVDYSDGAWGYDDEWSVGVRIPATSVSFNSNATGNCNLYKITDLFPWSSETNYVVGDMVTHNNINYTCILPNTDQEPPNNSYWINTLNAIIPAVGDGYYDVDLTQAKAIPMEGQGAWDYVRETDEFTPTDMGADWGMFDFQPPDIHLLKAIACSDSRKIWDVDAYKVEPMYARWQLVLKCTRHDVENRGEGRIIGHYTCFRQSSE